MDRRSGDRQIILFVMNHWFSNMSPMRVLKSMRFRGISSMRVVKSIGFLTSCSSSSSSSSTSVAISAQVRFRCERNAVRQCFMTLVALVVCLRLQNVLLLLFISLVLCLHDMIPRFGPPARFLLFPSLAAGLKRISWISFGIVNDLEKLLTYMYIQEYTYIYICSGTIKNSMGSSRIGEP